MAYISTTLPDILDAARTKLMNECSGLTNTTCIISDDPQMDIPNANDWYVVITPHQTSDFVEGMFVGGGVDQATVQMHLIITVNMLSQNDPAGYGAEWLTHATRGITPFVKSILKALAGQVLLNPLGDRIINQPLIPVHMMHVPRKRRDGGMIQVWFKLLYDWDMNTEHDTLL